MTAKMPSTMTSWGRNRSRQVEKKAVAKPRTEEDAVNKPNDMSQEG
jgi:hypothetical protein